MKVIDVRAKTDEELTKDLETAYKDLLNLRFRWSTRQLTNVYEIKKVRKDIARIRTVLTERALGLR
ncbi:MAG: 50S ribosomal protein L29 [Dehalococcoidia bacterium]|nr:50S ribosomal protein L29 [Dehalococcoidia bacterium]